MRRPALFLAATLLSTAARADDVDLEVRSTALTGEAPPSIVVTAHKEVKSYQLDLDGDGGLKVSQQLGPVEKDRTVTFEIRPPEGASVHYEGKLVVRFVAGGGLAYPLSFDAVVGVPILMTFPADPLDAAHHAVRFQVNRADFRLRVHALDADGKVVGEGENVFEKQPPGAVLSVTWTPKGKGEVAQLLLDAAASGGFTSHGEVVAWKVELPHAEVNFDTAKHELKASEEPKLVAVLPTLKAQLERYRRFPGVRFWIAGHTDTVDDRDYNQALSERRARTLAAWFRAHGVTVPVAYGGFGENDLLVPTRDETPEVRNRRATYILSVESPSRDVNWTPVP